MSRNIDFEIIRVTRSAKINRDGAETHLRDSLI